MHSVSQINDIATDDFDRREWGILASGRIILTFFSSNILTEEVEIASLLSLIINSNKNSFDGANSVLKSQSIFSILFREYERHLFDVF